MTALSGCITDRHQPLLFGENGRTFVLGDFLVGVYADDQVMAQGFGLSQRVGVTEVYHVEAVKEGRKKNDAIIITRTEDKKNKYHN